MNKMAVLRNSHPEPFYLLRAGLKTKLAESPSKDQRTHFADIYTTRLFGRSPLKTAKQSFNASHPIALVAPSV